MKKFLALAVGAAVAATATYTLAQTTPPGTDRQKGDAGSQSANPDMDKKKGNMNKGSGGTPTTGGTPTPPGSDRPAGEESTTSAKPNPDKK
jgi:hypothetical protein